MSGDGYQEPEWMQKLRNLPDGESIDLGGGYRLTKSKNYSELVASMQAERDAQGDTGGDDDGSQENPPGDTQDGVEQGSNLH